MESLTIRRIIDKITGGEIRIPSFQRGFVWDEDSIAFFVDSLYKGYPVGAILLWRTTERLQNERHLGSFELPSPAKDYPVSYVLDGQQRLTSIFTVFQTELEPVEPIKGIYYIIGADSKPQNVQFVPLDDKEADSSKYFPINALFDSVKYRMATEGLSDDVKKEIDKVQETFKEVQIPVQDLETDDKGIVAIVFERINRAGVPLETFQLFNAWSWSTAFDLQEKLDELSAELSGCGFEGIAEDQDLLMKCFTGYLLNNPSPSAMMELTGQDIRDNFEVISNGLKSTIDFLRKELHLYSLAYVPYPAMIVSLVKFFASDRVSGATYSESQRRQLVQWFWRSCFSRRYSSGVLRAHVADLKAMEALRKNENHCISGFSCDISKDFFLNSQFASTSVNTKTFIAMLASNMPRSFISGAYVDLETTLQKSSSKEFHHIFPDKYLKREGFEKRDRYKLANFCFLNNADNQKIKDKAPAEYVSLIREDCLPEILESALCPPDTFQLSYEIFLEERAELLAEYARALAY
ncbi:DUF262 domain-containing protein [Adlercreutzia sp. R25]|uniref:GmrSD restriction endonuclease domain-containing protein n=1 Tax=Adlercreutzia shanghongiae TaxID=3111773 RepID=UPI002DBC2796|nr:DUF262 domain-containing protein [Adlercreutzia sp. R25]MEC4273419.1 DUF262 domain-containing protein [Adlercreutzia sp. R25]